MVGEDQAPSTQHRGHLNEQEVLAQQQCSDCSSTYFERASLWHATFDTRDRPSIPDSYHLVLALAFYIYDITITININSTPVYTWYQVGGKDAR